MSSYGYTIGTTIRPLFSDPAHNKAVLSILQIANKTLVHETINLVFHKAVQRLMSGHLLELIFYESMTHGEHETWTAD